MGIDFDNYELPEVSETEDQLLKERRAFFTTLERAQETPSESLNQSTGRKLPTVENSGALYDFYRQRYALSHSRSHQHASHIEWSALSDVKSVIDEMSGCLSEFGSAIDNIEREEKAMVSELMGLDEHSSRLLTEQEYLEKQVTELEAKMRAVRALKEADEILNNRDIIYRDFPVFERAVTDVSESLRYILTSSPSEPFVVSLNRQLEHLRSRLCSITINVSTSVIDLYFRKVSQYMSSSQSSVSVSQLYSAKYGDTLTILCKICGLFRDQDFSDFSRAVTEIEKIFCECRTKIIIPIVEAYMRSNTIALDLPNLVRKSVDFVNGLMNQENVFFLTYVGSNDGSENLQGLLKSMATGLYGPLRTVAIQATDPTQLKEAAEIIRLEIFSPYASKSATQPPISPYMSSALLKLHKDIQERLIYRVESYIRDEIRRPDSSTPLAKTFECLSLISGVIDGDTFIELSTEAMNACIDALVVGVGGSQISEEKILDPIAQLLQLREKITEIDCMSSKSPDEEEVHDTPAPSVSAAIRRLVNRGSPSLPNKLSSSFVRARIESELKQLCEEFNATVIANIMTRERDTLSEYFVGLRKVIAEKFDAPGFQDVLIGPIVTELKEGGILDDPDEVVRIIEATR